MWRGGSSRVDRTSGPLRGNDVPKPFDAATKELLEKHPRAWLELLLGRSLGEVRVVDADLSTITSEADKILVIEEPAPWVVHVEFQSS